MGSLAAFLWEFNNTGDSLNSIFRKPLSLSISWLSLWVQRSFRKPPFCTLDPLAESHREEEQGEKEGKGKDGDCTRDLWVYELPRGALLDGPGQPFLKACLRWLWGRTQTCAQG